MATSFISTSLVRFDCNPFIANSCISLFQCTLSFKTFELEFNLFLENIGMLLDLLLQEKLLEMSSLKKWYGTKKNHELY